MITLVTCPWHPSYDKSSAPPSLGQPNKVPQRQHHSFPGLTLSPGITLRIRTSQKNLFPHEEGFKYQPTPKSAIPVLHTQNPHIILPIPNPPFHCPETLQQIVIEESAQVLYSSMLISPTIIRTPHSGTT